MLGYTYQNQIVTIGSKSGTTRTAATLTDTYTDTVKTLNTDGISKINLSLLYTTGAAETNNVVNLKVETSPDGTNWYQIPIETITGGASVLTLREFQFTGASAATAYNFSLPLDVQDKYMKFSFKETGVATNYGTLYVEATLSGAK